MIPIRVMSRERAVRYSYNDHPNALMISIRDTDQPIPFFNKNNMVVHYFEFDDVEDGSTAIHGKPISKEQANHIAEVVKNEDYDCIVVHCGAGVSRSAGVATAIGIALNNDDSFVFNDGRFNPNCTCYKKVMEAFGLENNEEVFKKKMENNLDKWREYHGI